MLIGNGFGTSIGGAIWDLSQTVYSGVSFGCSSEDIKPVDVFFKDDGTKMFILGQDAGSTFQYTLSTAWDISTASYDNVSFSSTAEEPLNLVSGFFFKDDGTKLYVVGNQSDKVHQYSLSTAWASSTASYDSISFGCSSECASPTGVFFRNDGTNMYITDSATDAVFQYTLSTAWASSTASYDGISFGTSSEDTTPTGVSFSDDGTRMFISGAIGDSLYQYSLRTAWDISTASYSGISRYTGSEDTIPNGVFFKSDGSQMYVPGQANGAVYQYNT